MKLFENLKLYKIGLKNFYTAQSEVERLKIFFAFNINSRIIDVGYTIERLTIGILVKIRNVPIYIGIKTFTSLIKRSDGIDFLLNDPLLQ